VVGAGVLAQLSEVPGGDCRRRGDDRWFFYQGGRGGPGDRLQCCPRRGRARSPRRGRGGVLVSWPALPPPLDDPRPGRRTAVWPRLARSGPGGPKQGKLPLLNTRIDPKKVGRQVMETSLHRTLKERYAARGTGRPKVAVDRFRIDAVDDSGRLVEVQSGAFAGEAEPLAAGLSSGSRSTKSASRADAGRDIESLIGAWQKSTKRLRWASPATCGACCPRHAMVASHLRRTI
jgi:hypothetical protein